MTHSAPNPPNSSPPAPSNTLPGSHSARPSFARALSDAWGRTGAFLCVGLDPMPERLPDHIAAGLDAAAGGRAPGSDAIQVAVSLFCRGIVDATASLVCAFKPQIAHFSALGCEGVLQDLISYIHTSYPGVPVILDAKRGDIGSTADRYAIEAFERYDADAVTVSPWLGQEGLQPFFDYEDRGTIVLCRTSNPDSAWLQLAPEGADQPYLRIAKAAKEWNSRGNVLLVAGATYPEELGAIRQAAGDSVGLLVPGVGAQGGDLTAVFRQGAAEDGYGLVVNSSRAVIYASSGEDFGSAASVEAERVVADMRNLRLGMNGQGAQI